MTISIFMIVEFNVYMKVSNSYVKIFVSNIWVFYFILFYLYSSLNYTNFSFYVSSKKF